MDKTDYIVRCPECGGGRAINRNGRRVTCPLCKGIGKMTYSRDYLMYQVMDLNRKINLNWETLNKKRKIPKRFFVNMPADCPSCEGEGKIGEDKCSVCNGTGFTKETLSKVFRMVFQSFTTLKTRRNYYNELLEVQPWKKPEVYNLSRIKPDKHKVVCTRCTHYLNENKNNPCLECTNCTKKGNVYLFNPITPESEKWYRREGYKWNYRNKTNKETSRR